MERKDAAFYEFRGKNRLVCTGTFLSRVTSVIPRTYDERTHVGTELGRMGNFSLWR